MSTATPFAEHSKTARSNQLNLRQPAEIELIGRLWHYQIYEVRVPLGSSKQKHPSGVFLFQRGDFYFCKWLAVASLRKVTAL